MAICCSCEKYDDFIEDFDYSAVYFATQKPLRTIVARDEMQFKMGVALSGKRENNKDEWVKFSIDPSLLTTVSGASGFTLLPKEYYYLDLPNKEDSTFVVPKGKFIGDISVKLNRSLFTSDPLSIENNYAIPVRIYQTSADSILSGDTYTPSKAYTIIVVKYIAPEHAAYYGNGSETDEDENVTNYNIDISSPRWAKTLSLDELEIGALGKTEANNNNKTSKIKLVLSSDRASISVQQATGGEAVTDTGSTYDRENKAFNLKYSFTRFGKIFTVNETLKLRQEPENDLRFEEW